MKQLITLTALIFSLLFSNAQTKEQDSLAIQLAFQKQDSAKVDTSIQLIKSFYFSNDYKKALLYIDQSERLSSSLEYHKATAEIKYYKALIYTQKDDYYNALDYYKSSLRIFTKLNDSLGIAKVNNSIGLIEIKRGNYNKGLRYSLSAIDIFENKNLRHELSVAYNNLSEAYFNTNQVDKALEFNLKALDVRKQLRDSAGIISSTKNIAKLYSMRKEHRKAIEYYNIVLTYLDENDIANRGDILPCLGEEYLQFNDYTNATTYLLEGLKINRTIDNKEGILKSLNNIAQLNLQQKKVKLAEYQLNEAFTITKTVDNDALLLKNYKLRVALDSMKGNYKSAFNSQRAYHTLKNKIEKENATPIIFEDDEPLEVKIDTTDTKTPIENNQSTVNNKEYKTLKYITYGLAGLTVLLFLIMVSLWVSKKSKNAVIKSLKDKNKQYKLQNDSILEQTTHLEEMNQVKDRLFSIVSHDLKDSITSVKAFLDLLKEDSISQEEFDQLIPELSENADNAAALLLNLLNWSKSQMQNLEPKPELFNIQDVFREKMNLIEKKVEQKRIIMLDESIKDFAYADRSMIEIVIQNLLANAVKFSRVGDVITVSNRDKNGNILICIEDTGVGISEENQKKLFKNGGFTTRGTNAEKGTGLGLSICKELVELNHGNIWVESEENLGSKFFIELPKAKPIS
ncbi:tetratricopeptide repeat protein [Pontimicrobium sp. IMCC45349]|uniref:tetratricopeptide repeat-containing sensor histidine kinase n=1 Tax=Pontimicrobium sp. IMCC45349 TaxID=3391574 RepID=UPI00399F142C